jgi:hypothetical protein
LAQSQASTGLKHEETRAHEEFEEKTGFVGMLQERNCRVVRMTPTEVESDAIRFLILAGAGRIC